MNLYVYRIYSQCYQAGCSFKRLSGHKFHPLAAMKARPRRIQCIPGSTRNLLCDAVQIVDTYFGLHLSISVVPSVK